MRRPLATWLAVSVVGGALMIGALAAISRALWIAAHGNTEVLFSKPLQLFVLIGGHFLAAAAAWGAPSIIVWSIGARRIWPRLSRSAAASALIPSVGAGVLAAVTWPVTPGLPLWLPMAVCVAVAFPPLVLARHRVQEKSAA